MRPAELCPEVKRLAEAIYGRQAPRDPSRKAGQVGIRLVAELRKSVDAYAAAAAGTDDAALLGAPRSLHRRYEMMVRTIRPVLQEVDEFHKVLYVVYHKDLPARDFAKIAGTSADLVIKAEAITKAPFPSGWNQGSGLRTAAQELLAAAQSSGRNRQGGTRRGNRRRC